MIFLPVITVLCCFPAFGTKGAIAEVNEKGKGTFVCADVDEFFAVCGQFPYQCEGRALRKQMLKLAERTSGFVQLDITSMNCAAFARAAFCIKRRLLLLIICTLVFPRNFLLEFSQSQICP
jgi:hypothetical protein